MNKQYILPLLSLLLLSTQVFGQQSQAGYHLFKPVPRENMREFALDRPDITESAQTTDAGHFQFEGDVIKWQRNSKNEDGTLLLWSGLYKLGLNKNWDFHFAYELYNIRPSVEGVDAEDGNGALTFRIRRNLWGNDGDTKTALGLLPYVTFLSGKPFDANEEVQFGLAFPFSFALSDKFDLGAQPQFDFLPNADGSHDLSFFQTIMIGGPVIGNLDFYSEAVVFFEKTTTKYLLNGGLIYNVSPNVKVDVAGNLGVNKESPTRVYLGLSFRI